MVDTQGVTEPLSTRQLEILSLLAEGLSNREIANRLYLSLAGVKWNNSEIYGKLSVKNRDEAVARATELGLLDSEPDAPQPSAKQNLPESVTEFVGRKQEITDLVELVNTKRLITILAPGGMGKTRLSLAVARTQIGDFSDGVYFVPLAPLSSPDDIVTTIAENIGFVFHGEHPPAHQLVNFLKDRTMLLVLDNFEHLLDGADLVSDIIQSTPNITIIVTSRERLNLRGENVYSLRGLEFPTWETPEDALEYDAVKLFMQSANRARSDFELHADDLDFLARICRLTAGMPLGIELAAGWVDVLSLEQIANEIQGGIDILETDMRDVPERHRSLRATFERTWNRLTVTEQDVFMKLSVFRGGFTLEAAEAIASANPRYLRKLAQKSLIQSEPDNRFAIHELLRQFGVSKLAEMDQVAINQARHADYFTDFMTKRKHDIKTDRELEALKLIDPEFENVRIAWFYCVDHQGWKRLTRFIFGLYWYCDVRARDQEIIQLYEYAIKALQSVELLPIVELTLTRLMVYVCWFYKNRQRSMQKSRDIWKDMIPILQQHGSTEDMIFAYHGLASGTLQAGTSAITFSERGYDLARDLGDAYWEGRCLILIARWSFPDIDKTKKLTDQAEVIFDALGNQFELSNVYDVRGFIFAQMGDYQRAKEMLLHRRQLIAPFQTPYADADDLSALGHMAIKDRNYAQAREYLYQSLRIFWNAGYVDFALRPLYWFATLFANDDDPEKAVEIISALDDSPKHIFDPVSFEPRNGYDNLKMELESMLEPERFTCVWEHGQKLELSEIIVSLLSNIGNKEN